MMRGVRLLLSITLLLVSSRAAWKFAQCDHWYLACDMLTDVHPELGERP